jgi:hypothetical protein
MPALLHIDSSPLNRSVSCELTAGVRHPMEGLRNQYFADLHDRLNIGIVRRVPLEFGGVWSKSACEHLSGVEGGVHHSHEGRGRSRRTAANSA